MAIERPGDLAAVASTDTIFALSSGAPPAAIAVVRISGPDAALALTSIAGNLPPPRQASLRRLRDREHETLDDALILWFPGPKTATGEDLAELHLHGGRAVVAAVLATLADVRGLRAARPGEFTRRAFANGRLDLAEAEGLADLLVAETESQRRQALAVAGGQLSKQVEAWRDRVLEASAGIEALLDFGDEDDVAESLSSTDGIDLAELIQSIDAFLERPRAELLKDGFRVVLAGPPNSGKSSLFNRLVEDEAAITAPVAGTTRDILTRHVSLAGIPFVFTDTAGVRETAGDEIEAIGIERAHAAVARADLVLWLGEQDQGKGEPLWEIASFCDAPLPQRKPGARHEVSGLIGSGVRKLQDDLVDFARQRLPPSSQIALNRRQAAALKLARTGLAEASSSSDLLIKAESLRFSREAFDRLLGRAATEDMLDTLFARFCIGK
jgi:tRNA modification GTPase